MNQLIEKQDELNKAFRSLCRIYMAVINSFVGFKMDKVAAGKVKELQETIVALTAQIESEKVKQQIGEETKEEKISEHDWNKFAEWFESCYQEPFGTTALFEVRQFVKQYTDHSSPTLRDWISVSERLPEIGENGRSNEVLVCRPNNYSGKVDILTAFLHKAKPEGQEYGRGNGMGGEYARTFKEYWSVPAIQLKDAITHWMPLPEAPNSKSLDTVQLCPECDNPRNKHKDGCNFEHRAD